MQLNVCYSDPRNGWYVQMVDQEFNQVGEASYHYHKEHAVMMAGDLLVGIEECTEVNIYNAHGDLKKIIYK